MTNLPLQFSGVVVIAFVFTALMFILYDYLVERRQHIVMDKAIKSTAVVSSLFPDVVRDGILNSHDQGGSSGIGGVEDRKKKNKQTNKPTSSTTLTTHGLPSS